VIDDSKMAVGKNNSEVLLIRMDEMIREAAFFGKEAPCHSYRVDIVAEAF
jgi:hypothetical protein